MSDETAITIKPDAPLAWGTREEVGAMADRLTTMLPNSEKMVRNDFLAIAQYCRMADINPFRGEAYFYKDWKGNLVMVDGYKLLVRWARRECPYTDRDTDLPLESDQVAHVRVWILRDDAKDKIREWTEMGAPWNEAFELVASYADGVVLQSETVVRGGQNKGKPIDPPTGWTWRQVARKRALKNALNLTHGAPSPREMAEMSHEVNGTKTIPADWDGAESISREEAERLAELRAHERGRATAWEQMTSADKEARLKKNTTVLRGDPDDDPFDDTPPGPAYDSMPPEWFEDAPPPEVEQEQKRGQPRANGRPYDADKLQSGIRIKAGWQDGSRQTGDDVEPASKSQVGLVAGLFTHAFDTMPDNAIRDKARHDVLRFLFGVDSTKKLTKREASVVIDWLGDGGEPVGLHRHARVECARIINVIALAEGQKELF